MLVYLVVFVCKQTGSQLFHHHLSLQLHIFMYHLSTDWSSHNEVVTFACAFGWPQQCGCASFANWQFRHGDSFWKRSTTCGIKLQAFFAGQGNLNSILMFDQCHSAYNGCERQCFASVEYLVRISVLLLFSSSSELWHINSLVLWNPGPFFFGILSGIPRTARSGGQQLDELSCSSLVECADFGQTWSKAAKCIMQAIREFACLLTIWMNQTI